jgi:hypothetical protein
VNWIVLAAEHQGWTLDAAKIRGHVEAVALAARSYEPCNTSERLIARRAISGSRGVRV